MSGNTAGAGAGAGPLSGKVALVTGGARGLGRSFCLALAEAGARVVVADFEPDDSDNAVHAEIARSGGEAVFRRLDVTDFDAAAALFKEADKSMGGLDILVNNAGVAADQLLGRMKDEQWRRVIETNLGGCFNCCRAASRIMLRQKSGRIISVSSIVASIGRPGQANYAASKAGIEGFTRSLALELAHREITVNAIAPGYIDTAMTRALPDDVRERILEHIPMARAGSAREVAELAVFLAGPGGAYITGQTIHVNGGLYLG